MYKIHICELYIVPGMKELIFLAKLHAQNGFSFYLPTKFVRWFNLEFDSYNNKIYLKKSPEDKEVSFDVTLTKHKDTYKGSFYQWYVDGLETGVDYLFRLPLFDVGDL